MVRVVVVVVVGHRHLLLPLEPLPAPQEGAVVEHVLGRRVQRPVVALAGVARLAGDLDEAVVEAEVVADRVLPGWEAFSVVREAIHDELTDTGESETLLMALQDGHGDQGDVRVGGLYHVGFTARLLGRRARRGRVLGGHT